MNYIESGSIGFTKETYSNVNVYRAFHIFCMHEKTSEEQGSEAVRAVQVPAAQVIHHAGRQTLQVKFAEPRVQARGQLCQAAVYHRIHYRVR